MDSAVAQRVAVGDRTAGPCRLRQNPAPDGSSSNTTAGASHGTTDVPADSAAGSDSTAPRAPESSCSRRSAGQSTARGSNVSRSSLRRNNNMAIRR